MLSDLLTPHLLPSTNLHGAHFGWPEHCGQFEWDSFTNFFQVSGANPVFLPDGTWKARDPTGLQLVCRLRHDYVEAFKDRLEADRITFAKVAVETVGFKPAPIPAKL